MHPVELNNEQNNLYTFQQQSNDFAPKVKAP